MRNKKITEIADYLAAGLLRRGFSVQRYDAFSTNSIYLKLDFGVCNSIRISDHPGKKHLKYRYNIGSFVEQYREVKDRYDRLYFQIDAAGELIKRIESDREKKKRRYGRAGYEHLMNKNKADHAGAAGFWRNAHEVKEVT